MLQASQTRRDERRRFLASSAAACTLLLLGGRAAAPSTGAPRRCRVVYVAGHERHAGIIIDRRDFESALNLDSPEFLSRDWLEFGWGDADFYQAPEESVLLGLKALFLPTAAVVHVHAFNGAPPANFPKSEVLELRLTPEGYARLLAFLNAVFTRDGAGRVMRLGSGNYGLSFFYAAEGTYHVFYTCNTWAADALAAGGLPVDSAGVVTVTQFMDAVRGKTAAGCTIPAA